MHFDLSVVRQMKIEFTLFNDKSNSPCLITTLIHLV